MIEALKAAITAGQIDPSDLTDLGFPEEAEATPEPRHVDSPTARVTKRLAKRVAPPPPDEVVFSDDRMQVKVQRTERGNVLLQAYGPFRPIGGSLPLDRWLTLVGLFEQALAEASENFEALPVYEPRPRPYRR